MKRLRYLILYVGLRTPETSPINRILPARNLILISASFNGSDDQVISEITNSLAHRVLGMFMERHLRYSFLAVSTVHAEVWQIDNESRLATLSHLEL